MLMSQFVSLNWHVFPSFVLIPHVFILLKFKADLTDITLNI